MLHFRARLGTFHYLHRRIACLFYRRIDATCDTGKQGRAKGWTFGCIRRDQLYTQHICDDLPPQRTFRTAAGGTHLGELQSLLTNDGKAVLEAKGHTFQHGTHEMATVMTGGQPDPASARIRL